MNRHVVRRALAAAVVLALAGMLSVGCSLNPSTLASSVRNAGDGYDVTLVFDTALNLPGGADVKANGASVGTVREVRLAAAGVDVVVRLDPDVRIPDSATGAIRQTTILGDPYVALESQPSNSLPAGSSQADSLERQSGDAVDGGYLQPGAMIPIDRTTSAPPLEDTFAVLATFINGGNVQKVEDVIRDVNSTVPELADLQRIASISAVDLGDVSRRTSEVDRMLTGLTETTEAIDPRLPLIETMFTPESMHYWSKMSSIVGNIGVVLPSIGSVFEGGYWLVPMLNEVNATVFTVRDGEEGVAPTVAKLDNFLSETIFPFVERPSFNIVSATSADGQQMIGTVEKLLRMLGAVQ